MLFTVICVEKAYSTDFKTWGEHLREVWVGVYGRGFQTLTLFKTKSVHFATLSKTTDLYILFVFCVFLSTLFLFSIVTSYT